MATTDFKPLVRPLFPSFALVCALLATGCDATETSVADDEVAADTGAMEIPQAPAGLLNLAALLPDKDINNDGYDDLIVGVPGEGAPGQPYGGYIEAFRGGSRSAAASPFGVNLSSAVLWSQDSPGVEGSVQTGDDFGRALAIGDFNGDGFKDVAVGLPGQNSLSPGNYSAPGWSARGSCRRRRPRSRRRRA